MRLINTTTLELRDFGAAPPPYAILSHTWGEEEVTFHDMADLAAARKKKGFTKIEHCCRQALRDGLDWAWVDTCCIDKTSSAELSETINSMFHWYERAMKCYAFLEDVFVGTGPTLFRGAESDPYRVWPGQPSVAPTIHFFASRWWTRGWTLQELIAPHDVEFYNHNWKFLARKRDCKRIISIYSRITACVLDHSAPLSSICVAERLSWASKRNTTRDEDMAYCLLGILGVNMPLLYGEGGGKAFLRLQDHVIANNEDYSLFLWGLGPACQTSPLPLPPRQHDPDPSFRARPGLSTASPVLESALASSPRDFGAWRRLSYVGRDLQSLGDPPQITSRGLRLSLFLREVTDSDFVGTSKLFGLLAEFFLAISTFGGTRFVDALRPGGRLLARTLFLAAFPCFDVSSGQRLLPCTLLLDLESFASSIDKARLEPPAQNDTRARTYARCRFFLHSLPGTEIDGGWDHKACFIKTKTDSELHRLGLELFQQPVALPPLRDDFWVWLNTAPSNTIDPFHHLDAIPSDFLYCQLQFRGPHQPWRRACCLLQPTERQPGCVISVAVRSGHYWLGVRVSQELDHADLESATRQLRAMNLSQMWIKTAREVGPICEERVALGDRVLVITLCIERSGSAKAYLALVEGEKSEETSSFSTSAP